jgi:hypothetical protein
MDHPRSSDISNGRDLNLRQKDRPAYTFFSGETEGFRWQFRSPELIKTQQNNTIHIWFFSFFHKDQEYAISFQRNIIETQKRSKQVSKIKTTTLRLTRIETKQLPRKHQNMKWSWMVSRFTWIGLCNVRFELTLLLATVTLLCFNSVTFLSEKWVILASGCVVNVFEGIDFVFKWEFLILEFWEMKKNGASLCYYSCAVFSLFSNPRLWN